ncbi:MULTISPECIES: alpha-1,2-fucosyltransferase [unclassified Flavobacterium]|uniref:alpha-1,2-fucosyltransferase n=1 Tax=unclassified Flavobacterium TaxID=196869 RepID=UPI00131E6102|nr:MULTISPECIES: alpha-1,2-fucosyltransferase [unclassified Flavobacterium]
MVVIKLEGGLGNQMFQYAFASILAKKNKSSIKIDKDFFDLTKKTQGFTPRNFELDIFDNSYLIASQSDIGSLTQLSFSNKIRRKLGIYESKIFYEPTFDFHPDALSIKAPVYVKGYFQSYKYLIGYEDLIRETFVFPIGTLNNTNKELLLHLKTKTTIAIHIRRGDYITNKLTQQFHGNCSLEYYLEAISLLTSRNKDFTLIFFSDDNIWVKEKFENLPYPKIFVDHNKNENSWKDMCLMSSCTHNIIANSSFSWWAAWLNGNPNKIVIAPKLWYAEVEKNTNDLIPPQWIRL